MARKIILGLIWLAFVIYAFFFSPPAAAPEETLNLIVNLSIGKWSGINPIVIALFYIMGIFPWVYGAFILFDSPGQKISAYPFFIGSIGFGAFTLLPYFALRQPNSSWNGEKSRLLKVLDSRLMAIISAIAIAVLLVWGLTSGSWSDFISQWQSDRFVNVMSLDFCLLCLLFPAILKDDFQRRGVEQNGYYWLVALSSLLGTLVYWCVRPQLSDNSIQSEKIAP